MDRQSRPHCGREGAIRHPYLAALAALLVGALIVGVWVWRPRSVPQPRGATPPASAVVVEAPVLTPEPELRELPPSCPTPAISTPLTPERRQAAAERFAAGTQAAIVGDVRRALSLYREAVEMDPANADAAYRLGRVYESVGEDAAATREFCRFLLLASNEQDAGDARARIARLASAPPAEVPVAIPEPAAPGAEEDELAAAAPDPPEPVFRAPAPAAPAPPRPLPEVTVPEATIATPGAEVASEAETRNQIRSAVGAYARAIESRDIEQLRGAYPGLTSRQQQAWEEFFRSVRDLTVNLNVEQVGVTGSTAEVRVAGAYAYRNQTLGRDERAPVVFQARLERGADGWRLISIF